jgi:hypothetical protein
MTTTTPSRWRRRAAMPGLAADLDRRTALVGGWRVVTVGALVATVGLAACGGGDGGGDARPAAAAPSEAAAQPGTESDSRSPGDESTAVPNDRLLDVCAMISSADVSAAFGAEFDTGTLTHHDEIGADQCIWSIVDPMSVGLFSLTVQRDQDLPDEWHDNGIDAERLFDDTRAMYTDTADVALGEKAFSSGSTVHVFYDDAIYDFMTESDLPDDVAGLQALAGSTMESVAS